MASRSIVQELTAAIVSSKNVPPTDRLSTLFTSHRIVQPSRTDRRPMPCIVKMATVAQQDAITGSHPALLFTNAAPTPRLTATIAAASHKERYLSARNDRPDEISALDPAGRFPSRTKCSAYTSPWLALKNFNR